MNLLYALPFWPYLYTPWLFREMAWMKGRGHRLAVVSLGDPPGPAADLKTFGLQDVPVLQVRTQYQSDRQLLANIGLMPPAAWFTRPATSLAASRRAGGLRQGLHEWAVSKRVLAFVRRHRIDVVEAHWAAHSAMMARQILHATRIPFAVRMHGGDLYRNPSPALQQIVESAAAICPVSQFLAGLLQGERPVPSLPMVPPVTFDVNKLRICHNAVPESAVASEPVRQGGDAGDGTGDVVVGMVGRLDPEKRHCDLLAAVALLAPDYPQLKVKLIGGGALESQLREQAAAAGIADRLTITGAVPWSQVIEEIRTLHIYAHGSAVEGCSLAILEGQAQGLPMLLSRTGAALQCVMPGINGCLFDSGDVPAQAQGLRQLIDAGPQARAAMGQASLNHIREHFLFEKLMLRVEAILNAIRTGSPLPT